MEEVEKVKIWSLLAVWDSSNPLMEEYVFTVVNNSKENVKICSSIGAECVKFALKVLPDRPKSCAKETVELEPFATKPFCRRV